MKNGFYNLALFVAVLVVCCVVFELGLRLAWEPRADYAHATDESLFWRYDSLLGWAMEPNRSGDFIRPEFHTTVSTNRYGLRDDDFPLQKAENEIRILLLGDSVVAGFEVERDSTMEARLERRLNAQNDGYRYQVINAGFRGYGTDQEYLFLERHGLQWQPDVVLLAFVPANDLENNVTVHTAGRKFAKPCFRYGAGGQLELFGVPVPDPPPPGQVYSPLLPEAGRDRAEERPGRVARLKRWVSRHLYSYAFLAERLKRLPPPAVAWLQKTGVLQFTVPSHYVDFYRRPVPREWQVRWRVTLDLIEKMAELCRSRGIAFAVWMFPLKEQVYSRDREIFLHAYGLRPQDLDFDLPQKVLQETCSRQGIDWIPTLEPFRAAAAKGQRMHYLTDNHFNSEGHRMLADILFAYLQSRLVRGPDTPGVRPSAQRR